MTEINRLTLPLSLAGLAVAATATAHPRHSTAPRECLPMANRGGWELVQLIRPTLLSTPNKKTINDSFTFQSAEAH